MEQNVEELYLVDEESESSKIKRFDIISYNIDKAIETIIKWKNNGKLVIPTFQREFVWKFNTSCKLID